MNKSIALGHPRLQVAKRTSGEAATYAAGVAPIELNHRGVAIVSPHTFEGLLSFGRKHVCERRAYLEQRGSDWRHQRWRLHRIERVPQAR